jgi:hypothetical protein
MAIFMICYNQTKQQVKEVTQTARYKMTTDIPTSITEHDAARQFLDGSKSCSLHFPPNIPANNFWSLLVYDPQTRSMLQTDQQFPSISSLKKGIPINPDSSIARRKIHVLTAKRKNQKCPN